MRTIIYKWVLAAAIVGALTACARQEVDVKGPEAAPVSQRMIHFTASTIDTKTAFGDAVDDGTGNVTYPTYWTENDSQVKISLNYESSVVAAVNADSPDQEGHIQKSSFDAAFDGIDTQSPYKFYVVSPASAMLWPSAERGAVSVQILANQTPTAQSIDEAAQIIVAESEAYTELPEAVDVHFGHLTAYGKLTFKNVTVPQGATVKSVKLISEEQPLSGDWYYKFEDQSMEQKEASSSLVIKTDNIDLATDPVWFACAPVDMGGKPLKVYVNFSNGKALFREITLKSGVQFVSGGIYKFSVNMASATLVDSAVEVVGTEDVYQRVGALSNLSAGDEVIIVNSTSPTYAMTGTGGNSGLASVAKDATNGFSLGSDGYIRLPEASTVKRLTVKSISGSSIQLWDGTNYLYSPNNRLQMSTSSLTWTISILNNGSASMTFSAGSFLSRTYYLRYNNNYFNTSTSSATVAIYKKITVSSTQTINMDAPVLNYDEYGAYLTSTNLVYNPTTDQISREYNNGSLTFAILAPEEEQVVEFSGIPAETIMGDVFTLGLTFISGITTEIEESYTVCVIKEEGHTLWLSDGEGNGFIVKR